MWPVSGASKPVLSFACPRGDGCCVSVKHRVIVVSCYEDDKLSVYDLDSGQHLRTLGLGSGTKPGQLVFYHGGLCLGFSGDTVMVAECYNGRVSELALADGAYVTHYGPFNYPEWVDCDAATETLLLTSTENSVTLYYVRTKLKQTIAAPVGLWSITFPARYCSNRQAVLVHSLDDNNSSQFCQMSLSGEELKCASTSEGHINDGVVSNFDADIHQAGALIVCTGNLVGPLEAVQAEQLSSCWQDGGVHYPHTCLAPVRDGSGTLVVRKRFGVHVLRNPERDLRWAWITAAAVAFA